MKILFKKMKDERRRLLVPISLGTFECTDDDDPFFAK